MRPTVNVHAVVYIGAPMYAPHNVVGVYSNKKTADGIAKNLNGNGTMRTHKVETFRINRTKDWR
jgi:hypothetical protein